MNRNKKILIVDSETLAFEVIDNKDNVNAFKGSGIQAASLVSDRGAEVLLTGFCGPNAFKTLEAANIRVASDVSGRVKDAVQGFNEGKYAFLDEANVDGHW